MARKTYWEKLQDPRWQEKRLRIMERSVFMCDACRSTDRQLQIHHGYYERGKDPWDYDDDTLWCLCENCHPIAQDQVAKIHKMIARFLPSPDMLDRLSGYIQIEHDRWMTILKKNREKFRDEENDGTDANHKT